MLLPSTKFPLNSETFVGDDGAKLLMFFMLVVWIYITSVTEQQVRLVKKKAGFMLLWRQITNQLESYVCTLQ